MNLAQLVDIDPNRRSPLHRQVKGALIGLLDSGKLSGSLPAPAALARDLRVFSGSIRRAYQELAEVGLLRKELYGYTVADRPVSAKG